MSSVIILTSDLTITQDVTLTGSEGDPAAGYQVAGYQVAFGASVSLTNFATATIIGNDGLNAHDVIGLYSPFPTSPVSVFWNNPGAVFEVLGNGVDAYGLWGLNPADVTNEGMILVTSTGAAQGVHQHGNQSLTFTNTGLVQVSGQSSGVGVWMWWGGSFNNTGTIEVSGGDLGAVGVNLYLVSSSETSFTNSGTITATAPATGSFPGMGVAVAGTVTLHNSGTIAGDFAIWENQPLPTPREWQQIIENSGTLIGAVDLGLGDDVVHNAGDIFGYVSLGDGNDVYDGTSGFVSGPVFGDAGDDTLIGGAGDDVLHGGDGSDTVFVPYNFGSGYTIQAGSGASNLVMVGAAGTDTLLNAEFVHFADGTVMSTASLVPAGALADLTATFVALSDSTPELGQTVTLTYLVQNIGAGAAGSFDVGVYLSTDPTITTGDFLLSFESFAQLAAGGVSGGNQSVTMPGWLVPGTTYYIGVIADDLDAITEANEGNNVSGGTLTVPDAPNDFNGDNKSDILWYNPGNGQVSLWQMNGAQIASGQSVGVVGGAWQIATTGDLNNDGSSDIVWYNSSNGQVTIWQMNGAQIASSQGVGAVGGAWQIAGTGDFFTSNLNLDDDILWYNPTSGQVTIWQVKGTAITEIGVGQVGGAWQIAGTGDFNGDLKSDILWYNSSNGQVTIWQMNGFGAIASSQSVGVVGGAWQIAGTGDFNNDGKSDILWYNTSNGQVTIWQMNGTQISSSQGVGVVGGAWQIAGTGDYNGDGNSDILWHNTSNGQVTLWQMDGAQIVSIQSVGGVSGGWVIA